MKLEKEIRRNGFDYEFVEKTDSVAIYKHIDKMFTHTKTISYEVFIIKDNTFAKIEDRWTYSTFDETLIDAALKKAYQKYNFLNK